jgi:hypothetical protein
MRHLCFALTLAVGLACAMTVPQAADHPMKAFANAWKGRRVVLTQTLYTVRYDEVGKMGITYRDKLAGLSVATPTGSYFEFDGGPDESIVDRDPIRVFNLMKTRYRRAMHLDVGTVAKITPVVLTRYEPGVTLVVTGVEIERDMVRLAFRRTEPEDTQGFATTLTVRWPVPFSKGFTERALVDGIVARFVADAPPQ